MTGQRKVDSNYFPALTGIRAVAAYLVFFHHYNPVAGQGLVRNFVNEFHIGVTIFFVLSGFLIAFRYADNTINFKKYMVNRFARIYPMYFLLTTLTFIVTAVKVTGLKLNLLVVYLFNITFLKGFFDNLKFTGIAQGWSLTVEETFYLLAPLFFILLRKSLVYLILLPVAMVVLGLVFVQLSDNFSLKSFFDTNHFMFNYTFFGRAVEFFTGITLAFVMKRYERFRTQGWLTYVGAAFIVVSVLSLALLKNTGNYQFGIQHPMGLMINNVLLPLFGISLLFYGLLNETTVVSKILSTRLMLLLGKSSYIFYLIHVGIFFLAANQVTHHLGIIFLLINVCSVALFLLVEEPVHKLLKQKFSPVTV